jgi:hypothetical protein
LTGFAVTGLGRRLLGLVPGVALLPRRVASGAPLVEVSEFVLGSLALSALASAHSFIAVVTLGMVLVAESIVFGS